MGAVLYVCNLYCTLLHCLCCIICIVLYCTACIDESSPLIALSASRLLFTGGLQASCHALQWMQKSDRKCTFSQSVQRSTVLQKASSSKYHRPAYLNFAIVCICLCHFGNLGFCWWHFGESLKSHGPVHAIIDISTCWYFWKSQFVSEILI